MAMSSSTYSGFSVTIFFHRIFTDYANRAYYFDKRLHYTIFLKPLYEIKPILAKMVLKGQEIFLFILFFFVYLRRKPDFKETYADGNLSIGLGQAQKSGRFSKCFSVRHFNLLMFAYTYLLWT